MLARRGFDVGGIDLAPTAIDWARENAAAAGVSIDFREGDVLTLDGVDDAMVDLVLDGHCLHCIIGADRGLLLASVRRVLRPGGAFVVRTMCNPSRDVPPPGFDWDTHCCVHVPDGGEPFATRYVGEADAILGELAAAGFDVLRSEVTQTEATNADLVAVVRPV